MTKPSIQIGTETREMTDAEFSQWQADATARAATETKLQESEKTRASALAKLVALGLTEAEVAALVGA